MPEVSTSTPDGSPTPIGPYSHLAVVGTNITIGGVGGVDPATGQPAGDDVGAQTTRILQTFATLLASADSDLGHVVHVNIFLADMADFDEMNDAYEAAMGVHRPARTAFAVAQLPKPWMRLTMNLTAVTRSD